MLSRAAAAACLAMMLLTVVDVAGRYFLSAPLRGAGEMIGFCLGLALMCAMPLASANGSHIAVSLIEERMGPSFRPVVRVILELLSAMASTLIGLAMYVRFSYLLETAERTQVLSLVLWPSALTIAVLWACVAVAHGVAIFRPVPRAASAGTS